MGLNVQAPFVMFGGRDRWCSPAHTLGAVYEPNTCSQTSTILVGSVAALPICCQLADSCAYVLPRYQLLHPLDTGSGAGCYRSPIK